MAVPWQQGHALPVQPVRGKQLACRGCELAWLQLCSFQPGNQNQEANFILLSAARPKYQHQAWLLTFWLFAAPDCAVALKCSR